MSLQTIITHPVYGKIEITRNPRARRIIMRVKHDMICITLPVRTTEKEFRDILAQYGDRLLKQQEKISHKSIDSNFIIDADNFAIRLYSCNGNRFQIKREDDRRFVILCPASTDFANSQTDTFLRKVILSVMRKRAKEFLPPRLTHLAKEHGFAFSTTTIRDSHTRWGSCSSRGNISLSIYLMMLSNKLIDYVLLHELCHTREMNHSERFWRLLDSVTESKAKVLRAELKRHNTTF